MTQGRRRRLLPVATPLKPILGGRHRYRRLLQGDHGLGEDPPVHGSEGLEGDLGPAEEDAFKMRSGAQGHLPRHLPEAEGAKVAVRPSELVVTAPGIAVEPWLRVKVVPESGAMAMLKTAEGLVPRATPVAPAEGETELITGALALLPRELVPLPPLHARMAKAKVEAPRESHISAPFLEPICWTIS
jgi:hypothetical protein